MAQAVVTGVLGFSGRHLAHHLLELGWDVVGSYSARRGEPAPTERGLRPIRLDLTQTEAVTAALEQVRPRYIFHLAGYAGPCATAAEFAAALQSHAVATTNVLEAVHRLRLEATVLIPGSSAQFGTLPEPEQPITETVAYRPLTLYGVAKAAEAQAADCWRAAHGLNVIRTNTFNCIGPGQHPQFVPAAFARQIAMMEQGLADPVLHVGNLSARRDVTDVRDVVKAYVAAATHGRPGAVYNVCSGRAPSVAELIEGLRSHSRVAFDVRRDPSRLRPVDIPVQVGDPMALRRTTGWEPRIPLETSLAETLDDWRGRI